MLVVIEGVAGAGKSTLRDRLLHETELRRVPTCHIGQFSWLSPSATRIITALRAGDTHLPETSAVNALHQDLMLHERHNLANTSGTVVADRFVLSSACLLALIYRKDPAGYVRRLSTALDHRRSLTVLLTTPAELCRARLQTRSTARRFGEQPDALGSLSGLLESAATAWTHLTGDPVVRAPMVSPGDTERVVTEILAHLDLPSPAPKGRP